MKRLWALFPIVTLCYHFTTADPKPFVIASNSDLKSFHTFSHTESSNFVTLTLESNSERLYIGGVDRVFARRASDITKEVFSVVWPVSKTSSCESLPQSNDGQRCRNQIQMVQPLNSTHTLICGTNYLEPENRMIFRKDGVYVLDEDAGYSLCSFDPDESVTSLMLEGSVGPNIFSTSRPPYSDKISLSKKMPTSYLLSKDQGLGTDQTTFVSSFAAHDTVASPTMLKVYAISDDIASDSSTPSLAPTITQVCANDIGGLNVLSNKWTSLLKVRLRCETTDLYPLEFNLVTDMVKGRDGIIYGTFTTRHDTSRSNAVCAFRLYDIQKSFNSSNFWKNKDTVPTSPVRPGMCAYKGMDPADPAASTSKDFPAPFLSFMSAHSWIGDVIKSSYPPSEDGSKESFSKGPLFIKSGDKFTKIAVEQVTSLDGVTHDIIFVAKESGHIHKFVTIVKGKSLETIELAQYKPTNRPIISMKHSQKLGQLYVGTADGVHQLSTSNCAAYTKSCVFCDPCSMCVLSRDPGCAWDTSAQECVAIKDRNNKMNLLQDVYHGYSLCSKPTPASPVPVRVAEGASEVLGKVIENPTIEATWYKVKDESTKEKITNKFHKFKITTDGQLEIADFDSSEDSGKYECQYSANSSVVSIRTYDVESTSPLTPVVTESPPDKRNNGDTDKDTTGEPRIGVTDLPETTVADPLRISQATFVIGLALALVIVVALAVVLLVCWVKRRRKYTPGERKASKEPAVASDGVDSSPAALENANNNNTGVNRGLSLYNDHSDRPLLDSEEHQTHGYVDIKNNDNQPSSSQTRNTRSLDNILDGRDEMEYIDEDTASDNGVTRQNSLREKSGRTRVPPQRTKSMPGSALYVVFAGKKLMCSTLQRREGTWTVELRPNQSGMSDMTTDQDEVIDIVNDSEHAMSLPSVDRKSADDSSIFESRSPTVDNMKDAREAFFRKGGGGSSTVHYVTSTPNNSQVVKPKVAPKPARLMSDRRKAFNEEQPSRASLRSFGQNSSEDRDSDSTVKGSNMTLKPNESPPENVNFLSDQSRAHKHRHHKHQNRQDEIDIVQSTPIVPIGQSNKKKRGKAEKANRPRHANPNSLNSSKGSFDRSSGSSDGADEQLHGRDKDVKRKNRTPIDSPSKQSRTSQGSSSSGDYRSARSSVISEPSHEHR